MRTLIRLLLPALAFALAPALSAAPRLDALSVTIWSPYAGQLIGSALFVEAQVDSLYEISSVTAAVGGKSVALNGGGGLFPSSYTGQLDLSGLARGSQTLTVTVTDIFGASGSAQQNFAYDHEPTITLTGPPDQSVARADLPAGLSCADDDPAGCEEVVICPVFSGCLSPLVSGQSSISASIPLASLADLGNRNDLVFYGRDSAGWESGIVRTIYVETSPRMAELLSVEGRIIDADQDRLLIWRLPDRPMFSSAPLTGTLLLHERASGQEATIGQWSDLDLAGAALIPGGAVFARAQVGGPALFYEWRGGAPAQIGLIDAYSLRIAGGSMSWLNNQSLYRRDLAAQSTVTVATDALASEFDLDSSGDLVYSGPGGALIRASGSSTTTLIAGGGYLRYRPVAAPGQLLYLRCDGSGQNCATVLLESGSESAIGADVANYAAAGGWLAYHKLSSGGVPQIWRRSPGGAEERLSFFSMPSTIERLADDGALVWSYGGRRYLSRPGQDTVDIGTSEGRLYPAGGGFERSLGRVLFQLHEAQLRLPMVSR